MTIITTSILSSSTGIVSGTDKRDLDTDRQSAAYTSALSVQDSVEISAEGRELSQAVQESGETREETADTSAASSPAGGSGGSSESSAVEAEIEALKEEIAAVQEEIAALQEQTNTDEQAARVMQTKQMELMSLQTALQELLAEQAA